MASQDPHGTGTPPHQETEDLKAREYRDQDGTVHHHTHPYMAQHGTEASSPPHQGASPHDQDDGAHEGGRAQPSGQRDRDAQERDLKAREYRDQDGTVHHHTHPYMAQHGETEGSHR